MNNYHLILFGIVWRYCYKIVSFWFLELNMCLFLLSKRNLNSETLAILYCFLLVECPFLSLRQTCCNFRLNNQFFSLLFCTLWILPNHKFNLRSMRKTNNINDWPVNAKNRFFVLFLPQCLTCLALPNYYQTWLITTHDISSFWTNTETNNGVLMSNIGDIERSWERSECWRIG